MFWLLIYIICVVVLAIIFLIFYLSSHEPYTSEEILQIVYILIFAPVVIIVGLLGGLKELICYIAPLCRYSLKKRTVGIVISDLRMVYAINGKLQPEKVPVVYKSIKKWKMVCAGGYFQFRDNNMETVYPVHCGIVCNYEEMKFLFKSFDRELFQLFSFKITYNIAIPVVTTNYERFILTELLKPKKIKITLIPEVVSSIIDEADFGLIYLAHAYTEITIVRNKTVHELAIENIGLRDLAIDIIKSACPSIKANFRTGRPALESLMEGNDYSIIGPDVETLLPRKELITKKDFYNYSEKWIDCVNKLRVKLPVSSYKWYVISDYGKLDDLAVLMSNRCSMDLHPINDSQELIAKKLSQMQD